MPELTNPYIERKENLRVAILKLREARLLTERLTFFAASDKISSVIDILESQDTHDKL